MSKKGKRLDPRVRRTRNLLRNALIELIQEKGYNDVTVKDITERATLNRATFYLHYRDKEDLLAKGFEEIWGELTQRNPLPVTQDGTLALEGTKTTILSDFKHLNENAEFYRVMLGTQGVPEFVHRMQAHVYESTAARLRSVLGDLPVRPVPVEIVLQFIASAYVGIMEWWLENDRSYTPEEMADFILSLYSISPFKAMGLEIEQN
ncbi:MAG: TetR/AcrR family transcriptional regulator [Anaerolineales bacterium]|jgi:AcrR family transcriptional regulator